MIVDTSAIVAIILQEAERPLFIDLLAGADRSSISAGSMIELAAISARKGHHFDAAVDRILAHAGVVIAPVTAEQAEIGRIAYRTFGQGSGHRARLNFGDCFAYALAKVTGEPLLFKGDDFAETDIVPALSALA